MPMDNLNFQINTWLGVYADPTPGVKGADNTTVLNVLQQGLASSGQQKFLTQLNS